MTSVVVLGKGVQAVRVAKWFQAAEDYDLRGVVTVFPEPDWTERLSAFAGHAGVSCILGHEVAPDADLAVSVFYDKILPAAWLARYGRVLNLHNAPLPKYRGVNPINWALKNGETLHGVTLHEVTPRIDDGPVVAQVTFPIWPAFDEVADVYARCLAYGWTLMEQTLPLLGRIRAVPQDNLAASIYYKTDALLLGDRAGWRRP